MKINSVMYEGLNGMRQSQQRIAQSANDIARAGTVNKDSSTLMDLAEPMVNMKRDELFFEASANVVKTADKMLGTLLDIKT